MVDEDYDNYSSDDSKTSDGDSDNKNFDESSTDEEAIDEDPDLKFDQNEYGIIPPLKDDVENEEIPLNGLTEDQLKLLNHTTKMKAKFCQSCGNFYPKDMISHVDDGDQCYHCTFWLYYSPETRMVVDGVVGITIADYILKCYPSHDTTSCSINIPNVGGCFLCDFINKVPIFDIIDVEKILTAQFEEPVKISSNPDEEEDFVLEI